MEKIPPAVVVSASLDVIQADLDEVLADDWTTFVKAGLTRDPAQRYTELFSVLGMD